MPKQPEQILEDNLVQQLIGLGYSKHQMAASEKMTLIIFQFTRLKFQQVIFFISDSSIKIML